MSLCAVVVVSRVVGWLRASYDHMVAFANSSYVDLERHEPCLGEAEKSDLFSGLLFETANKIRSNLYNLHNFDMWDL
jgi:hypothetical protein